MQLRHLCWVTPQHAHWAVFGSHGVLEYMRNLGLNPALEGDGLITLHHARCWSGCVYGESHDPCPGGPSNRVEAAVHVGWPPQLVVFADSLDGCDDASVWAQLDETYAAVMPDPDTALSVPDELPPPPDPGLAARLRDTPCGP